MIRNAGIEPHVVEYLKTPPSRAMLVELIERAGISPRDLLREKGTPYAELGSATFAVRRGAGRCDDGAPDPHQPPAGRLALGVKLCRPSEAVLDLLPSRQRRLRQGRRRTGGGRVRRAGAEPMSTIASPDLRRRPASAPSSAI
jgi:arsenate reductase